MEKINLGLNEENTQESNASNDYKNKNVEELNSQNNEVINFNNLVNTEKTIEENVANIVTNNISLPKKNNKNFFDNLDDFEFSSEVNIKIFGLGGAGNNMVQYIAENTNIDPKCLYAINTDWQFLKRISSNLNRILIGKTITKGMGSGSDPVIGSKAANEDSSLLREMLEGTDLLFIVSGMGKGTGTGASPVVAEIAKEMNILTIAVVNLPSKTAEGKVIFEKGAKGLNELRKYVDGLSIISNEKIINNSNNRDISLRESFLLANKFIANIVSELTNLVNVPAQINIDFNDVKTFFKEQTVFHLNTFNLESSENMKGRIINEIRNVLYQDDISNSSKAILNLKLNPNTPNTIISIIREALEEILKNSDFTLSYAVDYSDDIEFANVSLLISTEKTNVELLNHDNFNRNKHENNISENIDSNLLSKKIELDDLNLNSSGNTHRLNFTDTIDDKLTSQLKSNSLRENNEEMRRFIDLHNINTDSISHLDNSSEKIDELTRNDKKYNLFDNVTSEYKKSANQDFDDLQRKLSTDNNFTSSKQEITITKHIKDNEHKNMNSTSLNKFFTKTLRFPFFTNEHKNSKN